MSMKLLIEIISGHYLLTPWSRVILEKLTGFQLLKKFPTFYGTWRFITAFTSAHHLSSILSQLNPVHTPASQFLKIHLNILPSTPGSPKCSLSFRFSHQSPLYTSLIHATCPAHPIILDVITRKILGEQYRTFSSSLCSFLHSPHLQGTITLIVILLGLLDALMVPPVGILETVATNYQSQLHKIPDEQRPRIFELNKRMLILECAVNISLYFFLSLLLLMTTSFGMLKEGSSKMNPLQTKHRRHCLNPQFVPRCKHFSHQL